MQTWKQWLHPHPDSQEKVIWASSLPSKPERSTYSRPQTALKRVKSSRAVFHSRPVTRGVEGLQRTEAIRNGLNGTPETEARLFYSCKYLGITNGEIGILTQRKPIPPSLPSARLQSATDRAPLCKAKSQATLPKDENFLTSMDTQRTHRKQVSPGRTQRDSVTEEFLAPNPKKYDEFLVTKYLRPRPLTPAKHSSAPTVKKVESEPRFQQRSFHVSNTTGLNFMSPDAAKPERAGVLGWKLTRPKSCAALPGPKSPPKKQREVSPPAPPVQNVECAEAYIQYVLLKKRLRESK